MIALISHVRIQIALICLAIGSVALPLQAQDAPATRPPTLDPTYGLPLPKRAAPPAKARPDAQWIWADKTTDQQTVALRAAITLPAQPKTAILYVTADNFFTL